MNKPQNGNENDAQKPAGAAAGETAPEELELTNANVLHDKAQLTQLHAQVAEMKDRYLRAVAEVDNTRKRAAKERDDAAQYAITKFAKDLLNVADNFARALEAMKPAMRATLPKEVESVVTGIEATQRELLAVFERHGIKRIDAQGQRFDPNLHQAVAEVPSREHPPGTVLAVAQQGYMIGGRLLREAIVAVATAAQPPAANGNGNGSQHETGA